MGHAFPFPTERSAPDVAGRSAWMEVDLAALRRNAERLARAVAPAGVLPMVKADGYGLGALHVAQALDVIEPFGFGVATADEGASLRRAGLDARLVVFSPCAASDGPKIRRHRLDAAVLSLESLRRWAADARAAGDEVTVHLEIDTGMGRAGLPAGAARDWAPEVARELRRGGLRLASTFSHFHSADTDEAATREQLARFTAAVESLRGAGVDPGPLHLANSPAALRHPSYHLDLVRPGLYLFGGGGRLERGDLPGPEPVARVRATVLEVREIEAGSPVSYGATYVTDAPSRLATVGIGYADGFPLGASKGGAAIFRGARAPIRGAVCMDVTVVDVTGLEGIEPGAFVTMLGTDGEEEVTLAELAELEGTIEYEILTGLGRRLPRVYLESPEET